MRRLKLHPRRERWAAARKAAPTFRGEPLAHNAAIAGKYAAALEALVARMTRTVSRELRALFDGDPHFAQDASIASQSRILLNDLNARFTELFNRSAKHQAELMAQRVSKASMTSLQSSLAVLSGGMALKIPASTPALANIYKASVAANVSLIKSIPQQYLQQVEGSVMRSITSGRGLHDLIPDLEQYEGQTHRRARNIALDQTRKTYNSINKGRMQAIGVQHFMWHHSGGGAHPREDHIAMSGNVYRFDDPPVIDERTGETGIPGQAPNCKCTMSPVFEYEQQ